jgi:transposase
MNEPVSQSGDLPGLEAGPSLPLQPKALTPNRPRVKPVDRSQMVWRSVDVEHMIEQEHPARAIWALTGELDLKSFYAPIEAVEGIAGRTPWDPRLLVSLWVYALGQGISSAREIARRCTFDPGVQWLCGLEPINYHTLSDFRVAHGSALQELFVEVLGVLSAEGLVVLERVMHDGSKIKAYASSDSFRREGQLRTHLEAARQQVEALAQQTDQEPTRQQAAQQRAVRERQQRVEQALQQLERIRQSKRDAQEKAAVRVSTSDPEARVMKQADGGYAPSYNVQLSTEASHKIIVGVGLSQNSSDYGELVAGVARVEQNLGNKPSQVVADGGFTSRENILAMAMQGIDFIGSIGEQQAKGASALQQHGTAAEFSAVAFSYDAAVDRYHCPAGQLLQPIGQQQRTGVVQHVYRAEASVCQACSFKAQCCPHSGRGRSLTRSVDVPEVQQFREKMQTPQAREIYRQRAPVAEFPNAWIKDKLGLRQFRLRGLVKAGLEALWACLTYNIQQWIRLCWLPSLEGGQS